MSRNTAQWYPSVFALMNATYWPYGSKEKQREAEAEGRRKYGPVWEAMLKEDAMKPLAENDSAVPFDPPTVLQTIKARHDRNEEAAALVDELIDAMVTCTIGWGIDPDEVAKLYLEEVQRRRG